MFSFHPARRRSFVAVLAAFAVLATLSIASRARAGEGYSLHVQIAERGKGRGIDVAMPWAVARGGSPFDFVSDSDDRVEFRRLRAAWTMLARMPEGRSVLIHSDNGRTRAYRQNGRLVLEPLDRGGDRDARILVPSPVVEALMRRDGRLNSADVDALLRRHGEIGLVEVESEDGHVKVWIDRDPDSGLD